MRNCIIASRLPVTHTGRIANGEHGYFSEIIVLPGEEITGCALPHAGRTATEYLRLSISGNSEFLNEVNVNHTTSPIRVFQFYHENRIAGGVGNPGGMCWESHVDLDSLRSIEENRK